MDKEQKVSSESFKEVSSLVRTAEGITESFRKMKFVTITCIVGMAVTAVSCLVYCVFSFSKIKSEIYVMDNNGLVATASTKDKGVTLQDRIDFQARNLHKLLFTITPNSEIVQDNLNTALTFSDRSVYKYYLDLNERKFYQRMYQNNSSQDIVIDSVKFDTSRKPYRVATFATLYLTRPSNIQRSSMITRCDMIEVEINRKNPQGLQVENFEVISNDVIETRKR